MRGCRDEGVLDRSPPCRYANEGFFKNANDNDNFQLGVLVRVRVDEGFEGIGDAEPFSGYSSAGRDETADTIENILAPALLGAVPRQARRARITMDEAAPGLFKAKSALDIACLFAGD